MYINIIYIYIYIAEAGYGLTSLNSEWFDLDLTDVRNWPGPQGFIQGERKKNSAGGIAGESAVTSAVTSAVNHVSAVTVNQVRALWREKPGVGLPAPKAAAIPLG
jgi:hypothetical protein